MMNLIRVTVVTTVLSEFFGASGLASAQVTGSPQVGGSPGTMAAPGGPGVSVGETQLVTQGLSARRDLLGEAVLNDQQENIGKVEDLVITANRTSYVIVNTGRFIGVAKHNIAVPLEQLQISGDDVILPGATKETLKGLPPFEFVEG